MAYLKRTSKCRMTKLQIYHLKKMWLQEKQIKQANRSHVGFAGLFMTAVCQT